jgi:CheY-like chemotaxis protein
MEAVPMTQRGISQADGLTILVADDTETDRLILETLVRKQGHRVICARDGLEAVEAYQAERPDLVLMDALMPRLDGFEAARQIKELAGETLVPIIFLTSLTDTESLVKCLDAGGDDFLSKPYNPVILEAKIRSFNRMRKLHATMIVQRDQIARHNEEFLREQAAAKQIFDNVAHSGCLNASNVRYYLSSLAIFNGDVLVAAMRPSGSMMVLLGDFTGHGLPAAIGAMPLASTFYGMVHKGFSMADILREINRKLKQILPLGFFCCATMVDLNFKNGRMKVWNGGLPEGYIYRSRDRHFEPVRSIHLPLGVLPDTSFKTNCEYYEMAAGDRFFMWSDGIHESCNLDGEMFGEERLQDIFREKLPAEKIFSEILNRVHGFVGEGKKNDDLSLFEIIMEEPDNLEHFHRESQLGGSGGLREWSLSFEIKPSSFKAFDPLPLLLNLLMEVPGLRGSSGTLYTILVELYSNALEHGVLGLDSSLKATAQGFSDYYALRNQRLQTIDTGYIRIFLDHNATDDGGVLRIRVQDSGEGFAPAGAASESTQPRVYAGRGLALLEKMCDSVTYFGKGNEVEVVYSWSNDH